MVLILVVLLPASAAHAVDFPLPPGTVLNKNLAGRDLSSRYSNMGDCSARLLAYDAADQGGTQILDLLLDPGDTREVGGIVAESVSLTIGLEGSGGAILRVYPLVENDNPDAQYWCRDGESLYSANLGNVGIGTTNPTEKLTIKGNILFQRTAHHVTIGIEDGNTWGRSLILEAGGNISSHSTAVGGGEVIIRAGDANVSGDIGCPDDGPYGNNIKLIAGDNVFAGVCGALRNGDIVFYAGNGQPERMRLVGNSGNVGIGTGTPSYKLEVAGSVAASSFVQVSDARLKENVKPVRDALEKVLALKGVTFDWRHEDYPQMNFDEGPQLGLIAQEVESVLPEAVSESQNGTLAIAYGNVIPILIEAIKEQQVLIEAQKKSLAELEDRLTALRKE